MSAVPSARRRALMLVNPHARRGSGALAPVIERLAKGGVDAVVERFETPDEVSADIARRRHEADLVIVCGGDGTINSAAKGILETGLPMGIMPMGTANDLARTLGIPNGLLQAADIIVAGNIRRVDLGEVNGHPFFNRREPGPERRSCPRSYPGSQAPLGQAGICPRGSEGGDARQAISRRDHQRYRLTNASRRCRSRWEMASTTAVAR